MTSEHVCGQPETEVLMDKVDAVVRHVVRGLNTWSFGIAVLLSALHIGLAYIHVRESGGADPQSV